MAGSDSDPDHFCPGCGVPQPLIGRYPWYFCQRCLGLAENGMGQRLEFFNTSFSGGLGWRLAGDAGEMGEVGAVICLILGRKVLVQEARFGGVVAQPLSDVPIASKAVDLTETGAVRLP